MSIGEMTFTLSTERVDARTVHYWLNGKDMGNFDLIDCIKKYHSVSPEEEKEAIAILEKAYAERTQA